MKTINLFTTLSGPETTLHPGKHLVEDSFAAALVEGRYAEYVTKAEKAIEKVAETADVKTPEVAVVKAPENASLEAKLDAAKATVVAPPWKDEKK